ncbi:MAG: hypothetical protein ACQETH_15550, partial [Candidatus Rifleibacteriota bacterium]
MIKSKIANFSLNNSNSRSATIKSFQKRICLTPSLKATKKITTEPSENHGESFSAMDCPDGQSAGGFTARLSQPQQSL